MGRDEREGEKEKKSERERVSEREREKRRRWSRFRLVKRGERRGRGSWLVGGGGQDGLVYRELRKGSEPPPLLRRLLLLRGETKGFRRSQTLINLRDTEG